MSCGTMWSSLTSVDVDDVRLERRAARSMTSWTVMLGLCSSLSSYCKETFYNLGILMDCSPGLFFAFYNYNDGFRLLEKEPLEISNECLVNSAISNGRYLAVWIYLLPPLFSDKLMFWQLVHVHIEIYIGLTWDYRWCRNTGVAGRCGV